MYGAASMKKVYIGHTSCSFETRVNKHHNYMCINCGGVQHSPGMSWHKYWLISDAWSLFNNMNREDGFSMNR
jgi:hypothetical protein